MWVVRVMCKLQIKQVWMINVLYILIVKIYYLIKGLTPGSVGMLIVIRLMFVVTTVRLDFSPT